MSVLPLRAQTLDIMGRRDIGRVLEGSSGSPDLRTGMTSAILASVIGKLSFNILAVTLSGPGALFDGKDLIIFPTSFSITGEIQIEDTCYHGNSCS